jgi:hypothetical protein
LDSNWLLCVFLQDSTCYYCIQLSQERFYWRWFYVIVWFQHMLKSFKNPMLCWMLVELLMLGFIVDICGIWMFQLSYKMCKPWGLWLKRHQVSLMWHWDGVLLVQMFKASSTTFIVLFLNIYIYIYIYIYNLHVVWC